jgi:hypothetical protein
MLVILGLYRDYRLTPCSIIHTCFTDLPVIVLLLLDISNLHMYPVQSSQHAVVRYYEVVRTEIVVHMRTYDVSIVTIRMLTFYSTILNGLSSLLHCQSSH